MPRSEPETSGDESSSPGMDDVYSAAAQLAAQRLLPGSGGNPDLDRLAGLAARLLGTPSAMATLLTGVQTVVGGSGVPSTLAVGSESALADSVCIVTVERGEQTLVPDARLDVRLADTPYVRSGEIVAYLGVPMVADNGEIVGALCVYDSRPRAWTEADGALLTELAGSAIADLELAALGREFDLSRARWDLAIEAADMGTFELDAVSGALDWDDRLIELFGYQGRGDDEFDGSLNAVERRVHPDDLARVSEAIEGALAAVGEIHVRYRIVLPDGAIRWLQARGRTVAGPDGAADRMLGVTFDVTAQHDATARVLHLLDAMAAGVMSLNADFVVVSANREAERVTRVPRSAMIGKTMWELFPGTVGTVFEETYRRVLRTHVPESFEAFYPDPLNIWVEVRTVSDGDGLIITFVDVTSQHDVQDLLRVSVDAGELLAQAQDIDSAVATLIDATVPRLADWAIVSLVERGRVRDVHAAHVDPELMPKVERYRAARLVDGGSGIVQEVIDSGEGQIIRHAADVGQVRLRTDESRTAIADLAPDSAVVLPLTGGRGQVIGVLSTYRGAGRPVMTAREYSVAESICRRAGLAVENRQLFAALGETAEHDRSVARALQAAMLTRLPEVPDARLAARYLPAADRDQVGGDWYDALVTADGSLFVAIGDVVGHDIVAAGTMGQLRSILRSFAWDRDETPAQLLHRLDSAIVGMQMNTLATAIAGRLTPPAADGSRVLHWSSAGHPPPFVIGPDGRVEMLDPPRRDLMLGAFAGRERHDQRHELERGSTLVLYTDGLIERRTEDLEVGFRRLSAALREHASLPTGDLLDAVLGDVVTARSVDDVAMLAVRLA